MSPGSRVAFAADIAVRRLWIEANVKGDVDVLRCGQAKTFTPSWRPLTKGFPVMRTWARLSAFGSNTAGAVERRRRVPKRLKRPLSLTVKAPAATNQYDGVLIHTLSLRREREFLPVRRRQCSYSGDR